MPPRKIGIIYGDSSDGRYFPELLIYEGFFSEIREVGEFPDIGEFPPITFIHGPLEVYERREELELHTEKGNALIFVGNITGAEDLLAADIIPPERFPFKIGGVTDNSIGEGFLKIRKDTDIIPFFNRIPENGLHGFGCVPVENDGSEIIAVYEPNTSDEVYPAITLNKLGKGVVIGIYPNISLSVRLIREGRYVYEDGLPPADGMAPINDGILKAEDGLVLDWVKDRGKISRFRVPAFTIPVADLWRMLVVEVINLAGKLIGYRPSRAFYWPDRLPFIAHISHDTDGNDENDGRKMLKRVNRLGIRTTWCIIPEGYSSELCEEITAHGHEIGFHFDAITEGRPFTREELERQIRKVSEKTGIKRFITNKNHYTRWEGKNEFFRWLKVFGFKADQSKGPTKCGTTGFPFGTCHPWEPTERDGRVMEIIELCFQSQDFGLQGPDDTGERLIEEVRKVNGVIHIIFHPAHVNNNNVEKRMIEFVKEVKEKGGRFMTCKEIAEWYFKRMNYLRGKASAPPEGLVPFSEEEGWD